MSSLKLNDHYIPFHRPSIGQEEIAAVQTVLQSGWLTTGPVARAFEEEFAAYIGSKHSIAVNSATAALQLALDAIGLKQGDEVLVPTYTFTATAEVVTYFGATPVLCDSMPGGFNIDPADIERRITTRTRAIVPVHIAGEACDMTAVGNIAKRHGLHVIEDGAHALPSTHAGRRVGTISEFTAFSFYATKTITTAEGGMLTFDDDRYVEHASMMRMHGIAGDAWKRYAKEGSWYYEVLEPGYKLNMCDILAALGREQLRKCDDFRTKRSRIAETYTERLRAIDELELPPVGESPSSHAWHLYLLRIRPELLTIDRSEFIGHLKRLGIGTSVHFIPLHLHPFYQRRYGYRRGDFPHAEDAYFRCTSLPIFPDLTDAESETVVNAITSIVSAARRPKYAVTTA